MSRTTEWRRMKQLGLTKQTAVPRWVDLAFEPAEAYREIERLNKDLRELGDLLDNQKEEAKHAHAKRVEAEKKLTQYQIAADQLVDLRKLLVTYNITTKQDLIAALDASQKP